MNRLTAIKLAIVLVLTIAIIATPALANEPPDWHSGYAPYIAAYQTVENGGQLPESINEGIAMFGTALQGTMKYALHDINGNGSPELIVGKSIDFAQYYACDIYTADGGASTFLIWGGWESSIVVNNRSISYSEGYIIRYDDEYSISSDGQLVLEYRLEYDYDEGNVVSVTGIPLSDVPAELDWKPLSEFANESSAGKNNELSDWAVNEVNAAISAGLVPADLQNNYQSPISRASVAQMFINLVEKASGQTIDELLAANGAAINENAFVDTKDPAVLAANALGIINGVGDRRFAPEATLTRAQAAAIINRIARMLGANTDGFDHEFTDVSGHWVSVELGWPVSSGIINGIGENKFAPNSELTREQAIAIVGRALAPLRDAASNEAENDYYDLYENIINEWKLAMNNYVSGNFAAGDSLSFHFNNGSADSDSMRAYYALYDIDGNGIPELILRKYSRHEDIIAYIFSLKDGLPINVFGSYDEGLYEGLPYEVPWSRVGSSRILANGFIDSTDGDYSIYGIGSDGYSVIKVASAEPYDYPDQAGLAEAKWRYYLDDIEVEYSEYSQYLEEQVFAANGNDAFSIINWREL